MAAAASQVARMARHGFAGGADGRTHGLASGADGRGNSLEGGPHVLGKVFTGDTEGRDGVLAGCNTLNFAHFEIGENWLIKHFVGT